MKKKLPFSWQPIFSWQAMGVSFPNWSGTCNYFQELKKNFKVFPDSQLFSWQAMGVSYATCSGTCNYFQNWKNTNLLFSWKPTFSQQAMEVSYATCSGTCKYFQIWKKNYLFPDSQYFPDRQWGFHFPIDLGLVIIFKN